MSTAIQVSRVVCIFFMMYAHARGYEEFLVQRGNVPPTWLSWLLHLLRDEASRTSVPLLALLSGWLFSARFKGSFLAVVARRSRTLLVPLVMWNLVMLACVYLSTQLFHLQGSLATTWSHWINRILGVTQTPVNTPLYFLRDLFLASLAGAALLWLRPGRRVVWAVAAAATALVILVPIEPVMMRPYILPQFLLGIAIQRSWDIAKPRSLWIIGCVGLVLLVLHLRAPFGYERADEVVFRVAMVALGWVIAAWLASTRAAGPIVRISPAIFLVFCAHTPLGIFWGHLSLRLGQWLAELHGWARTTVALYDAGIYLVTPAFMLLAGTAIFGLMKRRTPALLAMMNGGRLDDRARRPIAAPGQPAALT
jgi:fucose 4-O-acetylase-like acetyltransferase